MVLLKSKVPLSSPAVWGLLLCCLGCQGHRKAPAVFTGHIDQIPDLLQTEPRADFEGSGKAFCAPVSVSNSLVWMHRMGLASFLDSTQPEKQAQIALVKRLAGSKYMNTDSKTGTGPEGVLRGLQRYLEEKEVSNARLLYQGWRPVSRQFSRHNKRPNLASLRRILYRNGGVWLNLGWYTYDEIRDEYQRTGGHWVTLVGYGEDEQGKPNPKILILHDPSPRAGSDPSSQHVVLRLLRSGTLTGDKTGLPRKAAGFYKLEEGMNLREGADVAILDGAVALRWLK